MVGLTSSYINNKLAAEGATQETKRLMLQFLNTAADASAIADSVQDEPVADGSVPGDIPTPEFHLGVAAARKILGKRNMLGVFTDLTQLAATPGFSAEKFNDLLRAFSRLVYEISAIVFNFHDSLTTNSALNIRRNFSTFTPSRSWRKGLASTYADSPAAYAIKETQGRTLGIRVAMKANGLSGAYVRATGGGALGPVKEKFVSFDSSGDSGQQTFQMESPSFHAHGVNVHDVAWRWQWRAEPAEPWHDVVVTRHRVYVVLAVPTLPWVQTVGSSALPWTDALEIACSWASGAATKDEAGTLITRRYNESGRVSYDTVSGATFYGFGSYNLTQMIDRLNGGPGLGAKVNCTDSADTVSTFANLLGCDLWQSRMQSAFALNPMIAIGFDTWAIPFSGSFSYHEVAWTGGCTQNDNIFDGCLKFDGDADPVNPPHTPLLPTNMLFGDCTTMNYRARLSPPTVSGCAKCLPAPATTRKRRPIV